MTKSPAEPAWFPAVLAADPETAVALRADLSRGAPAEAWAAGCPVGEIVDAEDQSALRAALAGSHDSAVLKRAARFCLTVGLDLPLIEPPSADWDDADRIAAWEALFRAVGAVDAVRAERYATRAFRCGGRSTAIVGAHIRNLHRAGRFEELLSLPIRLPKGDGAAILQRATDEAKLLRYGYSMPAPEHRETLTDPRPERILHLLDNSLPHSSAGYAIRTQGLLTALATRGRCITAATRLGYPADRLPDAGPVSAIETVGAVAYRRLCANGVAYGRTPVIRYLTENIRAHLPLVREERPAIIHAASNFVNGVTANFLARKFGLRSVYEIRGLWELTRASANPDYARSDAFCQAVRMETETSRNADRVICTTEALRREMVDRGVDDGKIVVVPNGVNAARFVPRTPDPALAARFGLDPDDVVIGYVGSVLHYEGLDDLLWALRLLLDRGWQTVRLLVVGDGPALAPLKRLAGFLGLGEAAIFAGRVPHEEAAACYDLVAIAPFPRLPHRVCELVAPLKPLEAMAMGKCVVVSNVGALTEIVRHGETGLVFEKGDAGSLAAALEMVLEDQDLRARLASAAHAWVRRERDWARLGELVDDLYDDIINERSPSPAPFLAPSAGEGAGPRPAFLYGFFSGNLGDAAVTLGAVSLARAAGMSGPATIVAPTYDVSPRAEGFVLQTLGDVAMRGRAVRLTRDQRGPRGFLLAALEAPEAERRALLVPYKVADASCVVYAGGEHLFSLGRPGDDWRLLDRVFPALVAASLGIRLVVLPITAGPLETPLSQLAVRLLFGGASAASVRDGASADAIARIGVEAPISLDPAFFLPPPVHRPEPAAIVNLVLRLDGVGMRVGSEASAARLQRLAAEGYEASAAWRLYRDVGRRLLEGGFRLRCVVQSDADDAPTRALAAALASCAAPGALSVAAPTDPAAMIALLADGAVTLTSRFHAAVFSTVANCPPVGVHFREHGHKIPGLFAILDRIDACFDGAAADAAAVAAAVVGTTRNAPDARRRLCTLVARRKAETLALYSNAFR